MRADVVDMYHGDVVDDFKKVFAAGTKGIIHKATQGAGMTDVAYAERRKQATDAGLLWGAYHFNTGEPVATQVQHFFAAAAPDDQTMMGLDFEDNRATQMNLDQACEFLDRSDQKLGRSTGLYSGNRIKEAIPKASSAQRDLLGKRRFWMPQYGPRAVLVDVNGHPLPWTHYWIWQFTGDGLGLTPHSVDGIRTHGIDINQYNGDPAALAGDWA